MRKSVRAIRNSKSRRNRHNGRINLYKRIILERGEEFHTQDGVVYAGLLHRRQGQDANFITSQIVKVPTS